MRVTRRQYPVGQGCFHASQICRTNDKGDEVTFRYVYDCGSMNQSILRGVVDSFRMQTSSLDALFVTHLDDDHVNGIDRLLGTVQVDTVYLPYVDDVVPIVELVEADLNGALSASLIEAWIEPQSWFGRRGVSEIVRVRASTEDGQSRPAPGDDFDDKSDLPNPSSEETPPTSEQDRGGEFRSRVRVRYMNSGAQLRFSESGEPHSWTLVPHVDPAPANQRKRFMKELTRVLCLPRGTPIAASRLAAALRNDSDRKRIRNCYEKILAGGSRRRHNRVSMSLYSGPSEGSRDLLWEYSIVGCLSACAPRVVKAGGVPYFPCEEQAVGWIGTGDAELRTAKVREAWRRTYSPFEEQVSTLLLPHHGSTGSFHPELLEFQNLALCVASAGAPSRYKHPGHSVVNEILNQGIVFCHVSQRARSGIREQLRSR